MPTEAICATIDEDPKLMNGNGMPVMGMMPMHMPTFSKTWNDHMATQPTRTSLENGESILMARRIVEKIIHA